MLADALLTIALGSFCLRSYHFLECNNRFKIDPQAIDAIWQRGSR